MKARVLAIMAVSVVLAGCTSTGAPAPRPSPSPLATVSHSAADQNMAAAAVLRQSDVGNTYHATPYVPSSQDSANDLALSNCLGQPPTSAHQTAVAFSPQFSQSDGRGVLASVTFVDSTKWAADDLAALESSKAGPCLRQVFLRQLTGGPHPVVELTVSRLDLFPGRPDVCAYRFKVVLNSGGQDIPQFVDLASAIRGRAEVQATFQDVNQFVAASFEQDVIDVMLRRLLPSG